MSDSGFRWLLLSVTEVAVAFLCVSSACEADEALSVSNRNNTELMVRIVAGRAERIEASGIVISPLVQPDEPKPPILVPPNSEEVEPLEREKAAKKPEKPTKKKPGKAPMATETASEKAREEWQKQRSAQGKNRKPKSAASAKSEKVVPAKKSTAAASKNTKKAADAKKKALMAKAAANKAKLLADSAAKAAPVASPATSNDVRKETRTYQEIYRSIPFSRTEYDANPSYRHLATMEIMLGQLHPVIVAPVVPPQPQRNLNRPLTIRIVPGRRYGGFRPGYRPWSSYPWH